MQIQREQPNPTTAKLTITADRPLLDEVKADVLRRLGQGMKLAGFRAGKAPLAMIERQADAATLQAEFLDAAVNRLYSDALRSEKLRPVQQPQVSITKFVPFATLEFSAEVATIGDVTLPDYQKLRVPKPAVAITDKEIDDVVHTLRLRLATRADAGRAAKTGDEVTIDFQGKDAKTGEPVRGAEGKGYPLLLGSDTFIPGFEAHLVGMKAGEQQEFTLTFPKDYGVKALRSRKVTFAVTATKVQALTLPAADDAFAAKAGPFQTLAALRENIRSQLLSEKQAETDQEYENTLIDSVAKDASVAIPAVLIDEEVRRAEQQVRQNLAYRGQAWEEFLQEQDQTEAAYRDSVRAPAEQRVKAGLVLTEIADREHITVAPEELSLRVQLLKGQYKDPAMQAELDKPENARAILSNLLTEKTIARLAHYATAK